MNYHLAVAVPFQSVFYYIWVCVFLKSKTQTDDLRFLKKSRVCVICAICGSIFYFHPSVSPIVKWHFTRTQKIGRSKVPFYYWRRILMYCVASGWSGTRKPDRYFKNPNQTETEITNRGYPIGNLSDFWKAYPRNILNKNWSRLWKETANLHKSTYILLVPLFCPLVNVL